MRAYSTEKRRFWERHIEKWKASGVSQTQYCRLNEVNIKSFRYWKRRVGRPTCTPALVELPALRSVPVCPSPFSPQLCLVVDRFRVEIAGGFDPEDLERVVRVLERI